MKLPFDLTQKPLSHKFEHGSVRFKMNDGTMSFEIWRIKRNRPLFVVIKGIVKTKEQLKYLLNVKSFPIRVNANMQIVPPTHERRSIEVVN